MRRLLARQRGGAVPTDSVRRGVFLGPIQDETIRAERAKVQIRRKHTLNFGAPVTRISTHGRNERTETSQRKRDLAKTSENSLTFEFEALRNGISPSTCDPARHPPTVLAVPQR